VIGRGLTALVLAAAIASPAVAFAQSDARFTGTVLDPSGAAVPNASVVIKNERTGEERTVTSNAQGRYVVSNLRPSVYTISVKVGQFAPLEYSGLPLAAAQEFPLDLSLKAPGVTEAITVEASAGTLDISSARLGVNVGERDVANLPVNGRQMSQLMLQAPGAVNSGTGTWQDVRFSGRAVEQNAIRYDGVEGSAIIDAAPGNLNGEIATPFKLQASLENVQEFRVESSNYPAEYGTGTGGQVNVVTKSGGNNLHGSLFDYERNDRFDAPNYFDRLGGVPKSKLSQHQFGGSAGGPVLKNRVFFFGSVEGYRLDAGFNIIEAIPSAAAWARAVPAVAVLRPGFVSPDARVTTSTNPDLDVAQLQGVGTVRETAYSGRVDVKMNNSWSLYARVFHDQGTNVQPEGVSGRTLRITANPSNAVFSLMGVLSSNATNELKIGYNAAPTNIVGLAPTVNGIDFSQIVINTSGSVANTGIAGQGASSGLVVPGGLVRTNSASNGHENPYDPFTLSFIDSFSVVRSNHFFKTGGEYRMIRLTTDRIGGTTYSFTNLTAFLNNQASTVQYLGDLSAPSPFNNGASGERHVRQQYFTLYAQDEWHLNPQLTLNVGLRYEYYTPLTEKNELQVKFNIDTGQIDPNTTTPLKSKKNNFLPRVSFAYAPGKTVFKTGFGIFVGPGQTEDQIQPIESDRISTTLSNAAFPVDPAVLAANFINNPNNRSYQPRAYANEYTIPERIYQYTASVQRELGFGMSATVAYVGSQGRNLFLRSVANNIVTAVTNNNPASSAFVIREFSLVTCSNGQVLTGANCPAGSTIARVENPFAEVDYKTSGGHDSYNAMQLSVSKRSSKGLSTNLQYTLGRSKGNTAGSNEASTAANNARTLADFDYDDGYNNFDVRHTFNWSVLYMLPGKGALLGGWELGGIFNARSGLPVPVLITRPDIVYLDPATGNYFASAAAGRVPVVNTPRGGSTRNVRRPDLVPGVDPYIEEDGLLFLNPAAFSIPLPGTFGNLERNSIHGPSTKQFDLVIAKRLPLGGTSNVELRAEVFNLFNTVNYANPVGTLPSVIPSNNTTEANTLQPGQAYTTAAAGQFGKLTGTVGKTVGLGTPRQAQFAVRVSF
jgi:hypothetical protein